MKHAEAPDLYSVVLDRATENYKQAFAWSKPEAGADYHAVSLKRLTSAEAQIEVLEIFNCGQVGGFDYGQPSQSRTIKGRLAWLKKHRNSDPSTKEEPKL